MHYTFINIEQCNMCGSEDFKNLGIRLNTSQGLRPKSKSGVATSIAKCRNCGLVFANPQPLPSSTSEQYDLPPDSYWNEEMLKSVVTNTTNFSYELNLLKGLNKEQKEMKGLDVGAGLGGTMVAFERNGIDAYGFEPSAPFYKFAIEKMGISKEKLIFSTIEEANYPDNFFDFITFGAVLEHIHQPSASLEKALKWLKPGGLIHIEVPSSNWLTAKIYNFYFKWVARTNYVTNLSPMHSPFHHYEFTKAAFELNGAKLGYELAHFEIQVCETMMPTKALDFIFKPLMKATNTGLQIIVFLRKK
jgi:2-polyprenyl-3-methyl-5-hydroxy-6-metoxy-1,4-benzoquinol methylase